MLNSLNIQFITLYLKKQNHYQKNSIQFFYFILVFIFAVTFTGCINLFGNNRDTKLTLSEVRQVAPDREIVQIELNRNDLKAAINNTGLLYKVRLIPILKSELNKEPYPEYRVFDIDAKSAYALLQLQNTDIIVGANDFIIKDPSVFPQYVSLLANEKTGTIEIVREGKTLLLTYFISD
jgi:hypothetical protein